MKCNTRDVFRILWNIYDGAFFPEIVHGYKPLTIFSVNFHRRYVWQNVKYASGWSFFFHELLKVYTVQLFSVKVGEGEWIM